MTAASDKAVREKATTHRGDICEFCQRHAKPIQGKLRFRHKCAHGRWCNRGNRLEGTHDNWPRCPDCLAEFKGLKPRLIEFTTLPQYFRTDSIERGVFKPQTDTHATREQLEALLSDAEFYADEFGPDMQPLGLKFSARRTIKKLSEILK